MAPLTQRGQAAVELLMVGVLLAALLLIAQNFAEQAAMQKPENIFGWTEQRRIR